MLHIPGDIKHVKDQEGRCVWHSTGQAICMPKLLQDQNMNSLHVFLVLVQDINQYNNSLLTAQ